MEKEKCVWKIRSGTNNSFWAYTPCKPGFNYLSKISKPEDIIEVYNNKKCPICEKAIECNIELIKDEINLVDMITDSRKEPKWLYRLESVTPGNGLWYNIYNELIWGIGILKDCKTKDLPMEYDERYHLYGLNWFSSCSNVEDLAHWYSLKDAEDLIANGFVFTKYLAIDYNEYENETTFLKETALERVELDIKDIWNRR